MALMGKAALAMWWTMAADMRTEFEDWHSHEHFPERLGIPGFLRASRWLAADGGDGVFVMYELADYGVLSSPGYLARLNAPTPWSTALMPHHLDMVRSQSHVLESSGACVARQVLTIRLSPAASRDAELREWLKALADRLSATPGFAGAHLLRHETPAIAQTKEQAIRGAADQVADWVFIVCAYDAASLASLTSLAGDELTDDSLMLQGAAPGAVRSTYSLSYSAVASDTR